jgi:hypothetical protein
MGTHQKEETKKTHREKEKETHTKPVTARKKHKQKPTNSPK